MLYPMRLAGDAPTGDGVLTGRLLVRPYGTESVVRVIRQRVRQMPGARANVPAPRG